MNSPILHSIAKIIPAALVVCAFAAPISAAQSAAPASPPRHHASPTPHATAASPRPHASPASPAASAATVYVRKNASTPAAKADLDALNTAMGKMKGLGCDNATSWYYQGGIHWVPDDASDGSTLGKGNALCNSYNGTMAQLKSAWDNCTHKDGIEIHFLVWHRLYIYYLEDIVRAASGKTDFALPYWNYVDKKSALMPAVFANQKSNMFEPARCTVLNQGKPIENKEYGPGRDLDITALMKNTLYSVFNSMMDAAPHGAMHNYIGGATNGETFLNRIYQATLQDQGGVMSQVPSAAFDPIFWVHHAEIDYIWQQWMNSPKGQRPSLAALKAAPIPYSFFDRNGQPVTLTIDQAYKMAFSLPVTYDTMAQVTLADARTKMEAKPEESATEPMEMARSATPQVVKGKETAVSMKLEMNAGTMERLGAEPAKGPVVLHLTVSFTKEPKGSYHLFLLDSTGKQEKFIGNMTFFGAALHARHAAANTEGEHKMTKKFKFDVSELISPKAFKGELKLMIRKDGDPKEQDELTIEEQSLAVH